MDHFLKKSWKNYRQGQAIAVTNGIVKGIPWKGHLELLLTQKLLRKK